MKQKLKKALACMLAMLSVGSTFAVAGCGSQELVGEQIDHTKTQLYVFNFNGGFGSEWLSYVKERYEELHKNDEWEEGKKGVQIYVTSTKANAEGMAGTILSGRDEVFFQEYAYYYQLKNMGVLGDITPAVTSVIEGENKTVASKLTPQLQDYYGIQESDGVHYYGIPHYTAYNGIMYNIDLFEKRGYYFVDEPVGTAIEDLFVYYPTDKRSAGPDGKYDTYDDGLPATYDEFFTLCEYISQTGDSIPLLWSGQAAGDYLDNLTRALIADYEGAEQFQLNFDIDGVAKNLGTIVDGKFVLDETPTTITKDNGYELGRQAGKYYAAQFMQRVWQTKKYQAPRAGNSTHSHLDAQDDFLYAGIDGETPETAMLIEGIWWYEEAQQSFTDMEVAYGKQYSKANRNFGLMPLPKATKEKVGEPQTLTDFIFSMCFMKANVAEWKKPLAWDFIKFCHTDESLVEFTQVTNTPKTYNYTMTDEEKAEMAPFGRSVFALKESADFVAPYSSKQIYINNQMYFSKILTSTVDNVTSSFASNFLRKGTAASYFEGVYRYRKDTWRNLN